MHHPGPDRACGVGVTMSAGKPVLIIGGNSTIGRALSRELRHRGFEVLATTRRPATAGLRHLTLDLGSPSPPLDKLPGDVRAVVACAAITREQDCIESPELAHQVNVDNTARVLRLYSERGARVMFLSTNLVLDGNEPAATADAIRRPATVYGSLKAEMEEILLSWNSNAAICRLGKVLHAEQSLLREWRERLTTRPPVRAFSDYFLSPVSLGFTVEALTKILESPGRGVYQMTGSETISYFELAQLCAATLDIHNPKIVAASYQEDQGSVALAHNPRYTHLDGERLEAEFALSLESPAAAVAAALGVPASPLQE